VAGTIATRRSFGNVSFGMPIDSCVYGIPRTGGASGASYAANASVAVVNFKPLTSELDFHFTILRHDVKPFLLMTYITITNS